MQQTRKFSNLLFNSFKNQISKNDAILSSVNNTTSASSALAKLEKENEALKKNIFKLNVDLAIVKNKAESIQGKKIEDKIFGELVYENSCKRVYNIKAINLVNKDKFKVWEKQRTFNLERANEIAQFKKGNSKLESNIPGLVSLVEGNDNIPIIIDGQHRVGAMNILLEQNIWQKDQRVLVELYKKSTINSDDQIIHLFNEINAAEPVMSIDLPNIDNNENEETKKQIINKTIDKLKLNYKPMFSNSTRCRKPNVNADNLRQELFESNIFEANSILTSKDLYSFILQANFNLSKTSQIKKEVKKNKNFKKAVNNEFYLGITKSWMY